MNPAARLGALTPSGRARVPVAWSLYDLANTVFSYAIVSTAIGLWLTDDTRYGQGPGQLIQGIAIAVSVGFNALISPFLGAISDRGGRRLPFLLFSQLPTKHEPSVSYDQNPGGGRWARYSVREADTGCAS